MKKTLDVLFTTFLIAAVALFFSPDATKAQQESEQDKSLYEVVNSTDSTSEFATILDKSGYAKILKNSKGTFTVLAPDNEAVKASKLKTTPKKLVKGQLYKGEVPKDQVESQMNVTVQDADSSASNGIVYVVDTIVNR